MRVTIILALLATVAFADSAVIYEFPDGRTVAVMATEEISMIAESVLITPSGNMYRQFSRLPLMDVWCVFHLVNLTDEPIEATVGFPLDANFGDAYSVFPPSMLVEMFDSEVHPKSCTLLTSGYCAQIPLFQFFSQTRGA